MGRYFFAWLFLVAFTGFVFGGAIDATFFQPPTQSGDTQPNSQNKSATDQEGDYRCEENSFWERTACDPVAYFTLWLTGFTGLLAVSTVGLWLATQSILRDSKRTSQQELRAYVFVEGATISEFEPNRAPYIRVQVRNSGKTPAYDLKSTLIARILPVPTSEVIDIDNLTPAGALGPAGQLQIGDRVNSVLTEQDIAAITDNQLAIYAVGRIEFTDAFGRPQWMTFRVLHGGKNSGYAMRSDSIGNDASRSIAATAARHHTARCHLMGHLHL